MSKSMHAGETDFETTVQRPIRLGVLGAAGVLTKSLFEPLSSGFSGAESLQLSAVAARDPRRAHDCARRYGFARACANYESLLHATDVDVVYIALPVALHCEWTLRALNAGKHVLCEKPFGLSAREAEACVMLAKRKRRLLMEAHHWQYHSLFGEFRRQLEALGAIRMARARFDAPISESTDIRLDPSLGAGVFLDFGGYLAQWVQAIAPETEVQVVSAHAEQGAPGVDIAMNAELSFVTPASAGASASPSIESGPIARVSCDMRPSVHFQAWLEVEGEQGQLRWDNPLGVEDSQLRLQLRASGRPGEPRLWRAEAPSTFQGQLQALVHALRAGESPPTSGQSIIGTQRLVDAVYERAGLPPRFDHVWQTRRHPSGCNGPAL